MADRIGSPAAMFVETAMTHPPLVSILLPVLNAERFLAQALDSIQAQTYPHRYQIQYRSHHQQPTKSQTQS